MEQRIYHGNMTPNQMGAALVAKFNRGNLRAQQLGNGDQVVVQVASRPGAQGGDTALCVTLQKVPDGVSVQIGNQAWLGTAASLGRAAFSALLNPISLIGRIGDVAQDIENLQLTDQVWEAINEVARASGASFELSERLRKLVCEYCNTPNPLGTSSCIACGAPLGGVQPRTCARCGFVLKTDENFCPNCGQAVH